MPSPISFKNTSMLSAPKAIAVRSATRLKIDSRVVYAAVVLLPRYRLRQIVPLKNYDIATY